MLCVGLVPLFFAGAARLVAGHLVVLVVEGLVLAPPEGHPENHEKRERANDQHDLVSPWRDSTLSQVSLFHSFCFFSSNCLSMDLFDLV